MKIRNYGSLGTSAARRALLDLAQAGLEAVDIKNALRAQLRYDNDTLVVNSTIYNLARFKNVYLCGVGKSSREGCEILGQLLGPRASGGLVIDIAGQDLPKVKVLRGTHPYPSRLNAAHTAKLLKFLAATTKDDLILFVVSGGGSTLLTQPTGEFTPEQEAVAVKCLFKAGATIEQLNIFRKHISRARGGGVAEVAWPATLVCLIFSDVPGDKLEFIASGPTVKDDCPIERAEEIIEQFKLRECSGLDFKPFLRETPTDPKFFERVANHLVISNILALRAMADKARQTGLNCEIITNELRGESRPVASKLIADLRSRQGNAVLLYGGESTVQIMGSGKGGRNQHLALTLLEQLRPGEIFLTLASDGRDNSAHAGAFADQTTLAHARKLRLDIKKFLAASDSFNFFAQTKDFINTGDTGSNVSDLVIAAKFAEIV